MEKILMGKVVSAVGIKGEIKLYNYSTPDRYETLEHIYLEKRGELLEYHIAKARPQGNTVVLKLDGVDDRNAAEALVNAEAYIMEDDLGELPEGTYYIRDLVGCRVIDLATGGYIGEVTDVLQNSAQDNYEVRLESGATTLIPAVREFIKEVDITAKLIKVSLIPGFIDAPVEA